MCARFSLLLMGKYSCTSLRAIYKVPFRNSQVQGGSIRNELAELIQEGPWVTQLAGNGVHLGASQPSLSQPYKQHTSLHP
jgi:hypothetical protein